MGDVINMAERRKKFYCVLASCDNCDNTWRAMVPKDQYEHYLKNNIGICPDCHNPTVHYEGKI